jgi:uncharacterized protein involved in exopolysaccharide biosynthesis
VESLRSEIDSDVELHGKVEEQLMLAESEAAEYQQQAQDGSFAREQWNASQARAALLAKRSRELQQSIQAKSSILAARTANRQALETALKVAQKSYETVAGRLVEFRAGAGTHAEQLRIIDPGTIPQRPSSPNISLNMAAALLAALILSTVWLSLAFVYGRRPVRYERPLPREMRA